MESANEIKDDMLIRSYENISNSYENVDDDEPDSELDEEEGISQQGLKEEMQIVEMNNRVIYSDDTLIDKYWCIETQADRDRIRDIEKGIILENMNDETAENTEESTEEIKFDPVLELEIENNFSDANIERDLYLKFVSYHRKLNKFHLQKNCKTVYISFNKPPDKKAQVRCPKNCRKCLKIDSTQIITNDNVCELYYYLRYTRAGLDAMLGDRIISKEERKITKNYIENEYKEYKQRLKKENHILEKKYDDSDYKRCNNYAKNLLIGISIKKCKYNPNILRSNNKIETYINFEDNDFQGSFFDRFPKHENEEAKNYKDLLYNLLGNEYTELYNYFDYNDLYFSSMISNLIVQRIFHDIKNNKYYELESDKWTESKSDKALEILEQIVIENLIKLKNIYDTENLHDYFEMLYERWNDKNLDKKYILDSIMVSAYVKHFDKINAILNKLEDVKKCEEIVYDDEKIILKFIEDKIEKTNNENDVVSLEDIHKSYTEWCGSNFFNSVNNMIFGRKFKKYILTIKRGRTGKKYTNIILKKD